MKSNNFTGSNNYNAISKMKKKYNFIETKYFAFLEHQYFFFSPSLHVIYYFTHQDKLCVKHFAIVKLLLIVQSFSEIGLIPSLFLNSSKKKREIKKKNYGTRDSDIFYLKYFIRNQFFFKFMFKTFFYIFAYFTVKIFKTLFNHKSLIYIFDSDLVWRMQLIINKG